MDCQKIDKLNHSKSQYFQGPKGPIKVKCGYFCYFLAIFSKTASRDDIDQLSRDGFD